MGVSHSMDDAQVQRVSNALGATAEAIQGINGKFDMIDAHWQRMQDFNEKINSKVEGTLTSFQRLDKTLTDRADLALNAVVAATEGLTHVLEDTLHTLQRFDMHREMDRLPKAIMPLTIPLIILLIELAVANAYLGILLSSMPDIRAKYSNYLLANAGSVLLGLTLSLLWLGLYRAWLAYKTRRHWLKALASPKKRAPEVDEDVLNALAADGPFTPDQCFSEEPPLSASEEGVAQSPIPSQPRGVSPQHTFEGTWEALPSVPRSASMPSLYTRDLNALDMGVATERGVVSSPNSPLPSPLPGDPSQKRNSHAERGKGNGPGSYGVSWSGPTTFNVSWKGGSKSPRGPQQKAPGPDGPVSGVTHPPRRPESAVEVAREPKPGTPLEPQ